MRSIAAISSYFDELALGFIQIFNINASIAALLEVR
jgi:hypothetical protein